jgi:hypothetical protein
MVRDDSLIGFLGLDSVNKAKTWSEESINTIKLAAQIIARLCGASSMLRPSGNLNPITGLYLIVPEYQQLF